MSGTSLHSRKDQIAELTRGVQLPLDPLEDIHLDIIAEMLALAWDDLYISQENTLKTGAEAEVTALMESRLKFLLDEDSLWSNMVHTIVRGNETVSFDGTHLEVRPDLSIYLTARDRRHPLVVECKLIDASTEKTAGQYCSDGLVRFIEGKYAWATREAFMLAYVRDGTSISTALTPVLVKNQQTNPDPYRTEAVPEFADHSTLDLARSRHGRIFSYPVAAPNNKPGPISLWHLWVSTINPVP